VIREEDLYIVTKLGRYNKYQTKQLHTYTAQYRWWILLSRVTTKDDYPHLCIDYVDFMIRTCDEARLSVCDLAMFYVLFRGTV